MCDSYFCIIVLCSLYVNFEVSLFVILHRLASSLTVGFEELLKLGDLMSLHT